MTSSQINAHLKRLSSPSPLLCQQVVVALFQTLETQPLSSLLDTPAMQAIRACLVHPYQAAVYEAVSSLLQLVRQSGFPARDACDILITALSAAGSSTQSSLAEGLVELVLEGVEDFTSAPTNGGGNSTNGVSNGSRSSTPHASQYSSTLAPQPQTPGLQQASSAHPLSVAIQIAPAAAGSLLSSCMSILHMAVASSQLSASQNPASHPLNSHARISTKRKTMAEVWKRVAPFFSFVLLHPAQSASDTSSSVSSSSVHISALLVLPAMLHAQLSAVACSDPTARLVLLPFLMRHLAIAPSSNPADRLRIQTSSEELVSVVSSWDTAAGGVGAATLLASALLQLAADMADASIQAKAGAADASERSASELLLPLLRLQRLLPDALRDECLSLCLIGANSCGKDLEITELLLYRALQPAHSQPFTAAGSDVAADSLTPSTASSTITPFNNPHLAPACSAADGLAMLQPLSARLAFGTTSKRRQWACHLLQLASSHSSPAIADNGESQASFFQEDSAVAIPQPASPNQDVQQPRQQQNVGRSSMNSMPVASNDSCASIVATALWLPRGERCMLHQCRLQWTAFPAPHRNVKSSLEKRQLMFARSAVQSTARWLVSLQSSLSLQRLQLSKAGDGAGAQAMAFSVELRSSRPMSDDRGDGAGTGSSAVMLLALLLASPHQQIQSVAASAIRELLLLQPLLSLSILPFILLQLRLTAQQFLSTHLSGSQHSPDHDRLTAFGDSHSTDSAKTQVCLLRLLLPMAADASVAPFALRVIQQLLQEDSPVLVRCLGLRLLADLWLTYGRSWARLEAALNGLLPPQSAKPLALPLRVTRAALLLEVCRADAFRGLDLVPALQQVITDPDPAVASLGLQALALLCAVDVLDFWTAWRVVVRWHPTLPSHPLLASSWVALLGHGALDAEVHLDRLEAIFDALWAAASHPHDQVRFAAHTALAAYPQDILEKLLLLRSPLQHVQPLLLAATSLSAHSRSSSNNNNHSSTPDSSNSNIVSQVSGESTTPLSAAETLALVAVRFEHANRRRLLLSSTTASGLKSGATSSLHTSLGDKDNSSSCSSSFIDPSLLLRLKNVILPGLLSGRIEASSASSSIFASSGMKSVAATRTTTLAPHHQHPAPLLLCYRPSPVIASPLAASTAAAVSATAQPTLFGADGSATGAASAAPGLHRLSPAYGQLMLQGLESLMMDPDPGVNTAMVAIHTWSRFFTRWAHACAAAAPPPLSATQRFSQAVHPAVPAAAGGLQSSSVTPWVMGGAWAADVGKTVSSGSSSSLLFSVLCAAWDLGSPAAVQNGPYAAAGFALASRQASVSMSADGEDANENAAAAAAWLKLSNKDAATLMSQRLIPQLHGAQKQSECGANVAHSTEWEHSTRSSIATAVSSAFALGVIAPLCTHATDHEARADAAAGLEGQLTRGASSAVIGAAAVALAHMAVCLVPTLTLLSNTPMPAPTAKSNRGYQPLGVQRSLPTALAATAPGSVGSGGSDNSGTGVVKRAVACLIAGVIELVPEDANALQAVAGAVAQALGELPVVLVSWGNAQDSRTADASAQDVESIVELYEALGTLMSQLRSMLNAHSSMQTACSLLIEVLSARLAAVSSNTPASSAVPPIAHAAAGQHMPSGSANVRIIAVINALVALAGPLFRTPPQTRLPLPHHSSSSSSSNSIAAAITQQQKADSSRVATLCGLMSRIVRDDGLNGDVRGAAAAALGQLVMLESGAHLLPELEGTDGSEVPSSRESIVSDVQMLLRASAVELLVTLAVPQKSPIAAAAPVPVPIALTRQYNPLAQRHAAVTVAAVDSRVAVQTLAATRGGISCRLGAVVGLQSMLLPIDLLQLTGEGGLAVTEGLHAGLLSTAESHPTGSIPLSANASAPSPSKPTATAKTSNGKQEDAKQQQRSISARKALKALETASAHDSDPRVAAAAAWGLAMICEAVVAPANAQIAATPTPSFSSEASSTIPFHTGRSVGSNSATGGLQTSQNTALQSPRDIMLTPSGWKPIANSPGSHLGNHGDSKFASLADHSSSNSGRGGKADADLAMRPLSAYPPDGAIRPLAEFLLQPSTASSVADSSVAVASVAAIARVAARAPRLPVAPWGPACRNLFAAAKSLLSRSQEPNLTGWNLTSHSGTAHAQSRNSNSSSGGGSGHCSNPAEQLMLEVVNIALNHGSLPSLLLSTFLDELLPPFVFVSHPQSVQCSILQGLPLLSRCLSSSRSSAFLSSLPQLIESSGLSSTKSTLIPQQQHLHQHSQQESSQHAQLDEQQQQQCLQLQLAVSAWQGLASCLQGTQVPAGSGSQTSHGQQQQPADLLTTMRGMCMLLPPLPQLQPGALHLMTHRIKTSAAELATATINKNSPPTASAPRTVSNPVKGVSPSLDPGSAGDLVPVTDRERLLQTLWVTSVSCLITTWQSGWLKEVTEAMLQPSPAQSLHTNTPTPANNGTRAQQTESARKMSTSEQSSSVQPGSSSMSALQVAGWQLRCLLVLAGSMEVSALGPCRTLIMQGSGGSMLGSRGPLQLLLVIATAVSPLTAQVQFLMDALTAAAAAAVLSAASSHATSVTPSPAGTGCQHEDRLSALLHYTADLAAAFLHKAAGAQLCVETHVALTDSGSAVRCLPYILPRLLAVPAWQPSAPAVASALASILTAVAANAKQAGSSPMSADPSAGLISGCGIDSSESQEGAAGLSAAAVFSVCTACLAAMRDGVASKQCYAALSALVCV